MLIRDLKGKMQLRYFDSLILTVIDSMTGQNYYVYLSWAWLKIYLPRIL